MYDHFGWHVHARSTSRPTTALLAETHEYFHRQLDDTTAFGGLTATIAALTVSLPSEADWSASRNRLLAMSDLVHETFAVAASLLTTQRLIAPIDGYPSYDRHIRAAVRLLGSDVHPWVALAAIRAAATVSMQSTALRLAVDAGLESFDPSMVPAIDRPNNRMAALISAGYDTTVWDEQQKVAKVYGSKEWWKPRDGVLLQPDAMHGEASRAFGLVYNRLFDAAASTIQAAGASPVVALDGHHEHLRALLSEARTLAPEGLARIGALVEAPGGELLHGGPLDGQVIELSRAPRRAVVLPFSSTSEASGEAESRHAFVVVTTPRRIRSAYQLEGVNLPSSETVAAARTTVFDGDSPDAVLHLLLDGPYQLSDELQTYVSVMSSAVAADPESTSAWLSSCDVDHVSLVMDTPVTATIRRWCADGALFRTETRLVESGDDNVWIIAGRLEDPGRRSPLVVVPTTEFGARWFEAARAEDPLLRRVIVDDVGLFDREVSHLNVVLTHLLVEERYVGSGSWRS